MHENTPPDKFLYDEDLEAIENDDIYLDDVFLEDGEDSDGTEEFIGYDEYETGEEQEIKYGAPERDDAFLTFHKHTAAIFSCSLHPTEDLAATGSEDDKAYVWNTKTGDIVHEIDNHKDTVIGAFFNHDGNYLATGDMSGEIQVFKLQQNTFKKIWDYSMGDMGWIKWHPYANVLLAGGDTGEIYVWRIPSGDCKVMPGNGHKCETGELTSDGKKLFAGYSDGTVKLWDLKSNTTIIEVNSDNPIGHKESIASVSCDPHKSLYLSGGEDGKILLISNSGAVGMLDPEAGPIEAVSFCPESELDIAASGTLHGQIAIWDIQKQSIRHICEHNESDDGITMMKWLPNHTLICGTIQGNIFAYDGFSGSKKFELKGHVAEVYDMCYDKREGIILTISEDSTAKLFKVNLS